MSHLRAGWRVGRPQCGRSGGRTRPQPGARCSVLRSVVGGSYRRRRCLRSPNDGYDPRSDAFLMIWHRGADGRRRLGLARPSADRGGAPHRTGRAAGAEADPCDRLSARVSAAARPLALGDVARGGMPPGSGCSLVRNASPGRARTPTPSSFGAGGRVCADPCGATCRPASTRGRCARSGRDGARPRAGRPHAFRRSQDGSAHWDKGRQIGEVPVPRLPDRRRCWPSPRRPWFRTSAAVEVGADRALEFVEAAR